MPRVRLAVPAAQLELEDELRSRYGGMMTAAEVGRELGISDHTTYEKWLADVKFVRVNNRKRWRVADVAGKIYRNTEEPVT